MWVKPDEAETEYLRVREYLQAGRAAPTHGNGCRLSELGNRFLNGKQSMVDSSELSLRTFHDYHAGCAEIIEHFGRERLVKDCRPDDFEAFRVKPHKGRGPHAIGKMVTLTTMVVGFAYDNEMIEKPIRFGQQFARPSKKTMRPHRARKQETHGLRMFEAAEIWQLIAAAAPAVKARFYWLRMEGLETATWRTCRSLHSKATGCNFQESKPVSIVASRYGPKRFRHSQRRLRFVRHQKTRQTMAFAS